MRTRTRAFLGLAVSAVLVAILIWQIDPRRVIETLRDMRPGILLIAIVPLSADVAIRTVRWRVLMAREPRPGYHDTFRFLTVGYLANVIFPLRLGELVRAHLAGTRGGVGSSRALGSIAMERALDVTCAAVIGALAAIAAGLPQALVAGFGGLALAAGAVVVAFTLTPRAWSGRLVDGVIGRADRGRLAGLARAVGRFAHGLLDAASPLVVLAATGLSFASWLVSATVFGVAAWSLGLSVAPAVLVAMVVAANLGAAIPSAPAGIGPYEVGVVVVGTLAGLDAHVALALGIAAHLTTTLPVSLVGAWQLGQIRWDLRNLQRVGDGARFGGAEGS